MPLLPQFPHLSETVGDKHNSFTLSSWNHQDPRIPGGETEAQGREQLPGRGGLAWWGAVNSQAKRWAGCRGTARPPRGQGIVRGHKGGVGRLPTEKEELMAVAVGSQQQRRAVKAALALWGSGPKFRTPAGCVLPWPAG